MVDAGQAKRCCAATYSSDVVEALLGPAYHPGGLTLTRRLLNVAHLRADESLLDIASGIGTTSYVAAVEYGAQAAGVDLSEANVATARQGAETRNLTGRVSFHLGDAEALPFPDGTYDLVVCECALCTFPDKLTAVAEMARVLRPGGRLAMSDVTADPAKLPAELTSLFAWVACIADARPAEEYADLLAAAGLKIDLVEPHDEALSRMIDQIEARLTLLRMTAPDQTTTPGPITLGLDFQAAATVIRAAREATEAGVLGYAMIIASK